MENKEAESSFPNGKIVLCDGRVLECYPLEQQHIADENNVELDTTGQYLTYGNNKHRTHATRDEEKMAQEQLFMENALFLFNNQERILADSRMFLCPIAVENSIAYTGTSGLRAPTLGIYIEWWNSCSGTVRVNDDGSRSIVCRISGSPLSGSNSCTAVRDDGKIESISLNPFSEHWVPFTRINKRYSEAKARYKAYTLQQVLDILKSAEHKA